MKVFSLMTGADTGGWGGRMTAGFRRHAPDWELRSMAASATYLEYPFDLPYRQALLEPLYDAADVIHLHNTLHGHEFYDAGQGKPIVLMYHGSAFRAAPERYLAEARAVGAVQLCSTLDLERPGVAWLGAPYELDGPICAVSNRPVPYSFAELRMRRFAPTDKIRIAHAPTDRTVKGTGRVLAALRSLAERGLPIELVFIEGQPWATCLARKAMADIFVDQLVLGYGNNAIEAWAMGIPVVAGVADPRVRARMLRRWARLPFTEASEETLEDVLEQLVRSAAMRAEYAAIGTEHVRRWHDAAVVVPRLQQLYRSAKPTRPGAGSRRKTRPVLEAVA